MYREQISAGSRRDEGAGAIAGKVLIVIPCLNERNHIGPLLEHVREDTAALDRLMVVADGGSTDGTHAIVAAYAERDPTVKLLSNPKRIQSAGVNLAVRSFGAGRRWLVRLDAHAQYPAGYTRILIEEAQRTGAASVVVAMRSLGAQPFQCAVAAVQNSVLGAGGAPHRRSGHAQFVDHGHHALFDLARFVDLHGYDESASHNEDAEFDLRLTRAGGKIWLTRAVEVGYVPRSSPRSLYWQYVCYGRGRAATLLRHRQRPKLRQVLPATVLPALAGAALAPWHAIAAAPALLWVVLCLLGGAATGIKLGRRGPLLAVLAAMTIHLGWSVGFWREAASRLRRGNGEAFNAIATAEDAAS